MPTCLLPPPRDARAKRAVLASKAGRCPSSRVGSKVPKPNGNPFGSTGIGKAKGKCKSALAALPRFLASPRGGMVSQDPDQLFRRFGLCARPSLEKAFLHVVQKDRQRKIQHGVAQSLGRLIMSLPING